MIPLRVVLLSVAVAGAGHAADNSGAYSIRGAGSDMCRVYNEARENLDVFNSKGYVSWIAGYLTSINRWSRGVVDIGSGDAGDFIIVWIDGFCARFPDRPLAHAVEAYVVLREQERVQRQER